MQKIGDVCEVNEKSISVMDKKKHNYFHYLDLTNLTENKIDTIERVEAEKLPSRAKRIVRKNDVIVSTVRPNQRHHGILTDIPDNLLVSTGYTVLTVDEKKANPHYLYHYISNQFSQKRMELIAQTSTSSYPSLRPEDISELKYTKKDLNYQNEVGEILSLIEKKMKINRKELNSLEEYSRLLFYKWFVHFNFPNEDGKPYRDNGGEMVEIDGKFIPRGWEYSRLRSIIQNDKNGEWGNDEPLLGSSSDFYCVRGTDIPQLKEGRIKGTPIRYRSDKKQICLEHNDIVLEISHASNPGRSFLVRNTLLKKLNKPLYFSNFSKAIKPKEGYACFLYAMLIKLHRQGVLLRYTASSNIKNISVESLARNYKIPIPDKKTLSEFENTLSVLIEKIYSLGHENEVLEETKDLLIHKLIK